ncbi:MAG: DUF5317 domain-containing protein [Clostridiales bacterium]|nr:DUF5317 domain-containing protein [Clostridiales bacterium]
MGLIIGFIRRGRLKNLTVLILNRWYYIFISLVIKVVHGYILLSFNDFLTPLYSFILVILQYLFLFLFIYNNRKYPYIWLASLGILANFIVMVFNFGSMPVTCRILDLAPPSLRMTLLSEGRYYTYTLIDPKTILWFLGDIILIPFPYRQFISIGDILLGLGICMLVQRVMQDGYNGFKRAKGNKIDKKIWDEPESCH